MWRIKSTACILGFNYFDVWLKGFIELGVIKDHAERQTIDVGMGVKFTRQQRRYEIYIYCQPTIQQAPLTTGAPRGETRPQKRSDPPSNHRLHNYHDFSNFRISHTDERAYCQRAKRFGFKACPKCGVPCVHYTSFLEVKEPFLVNPFMNSWQCFPENSNV